MFEFVIVFIYNMKGIYIYISMLGINGLKVKVKLKR